MIPSIIGIVPQRLTEAVESAIGKYVSHGRLKLTQIMALLTTEFPGIVTCERQVRNVMSKFQRGPTGYSCRELLQRLMLQQRADPDFFVDYKLNEDNELVGVLWITAEQRRA